MNLIVMFPPMFSSLKFSSLLRFHVTLHQIRKSIGRRKKLKRWKRDKYLPKLRAEKDWKWQWFAGSKLIFFLLRKDVSLQWKSWKLDFIMRKFFWKRRAPKESKGFRLRENKEAEIKKDILENVVYRRRKGCEEKDTNKSRFLLLLSGPLISVSQNLISSNLVRIIVFQRRNKR